MPIRLKWKNPNTGTPVVKIYRNAAAMDVSNMSAANQIATISDGSLTYLDDVPKYGESYYYVFSVTVNGREIFTPNKLYQCILDLGPGPQDIQFGDFKLGYFGALTMADLGLTTVLFGGAVVSRLFKIVRNGKILFIAGNTVLAYTSLLIAGKTFSSGVTPANDPLAGAGGRIIDSNGRLYAPRVAKLFDEANTDKVLSNYGLYSGRNYTGGGYANTPVGKSELVDIMRMCRTSDFTWQTRFSLGSDTTGFSANQYTTMMGTCDFASTTTQLVVSNLGNFGTSSSAVPITGTASQCLFHPVIEYKGLV